MTRGAWGLEDLLGSRSNGGRTEFVDFAHQVREGGSTGPRKSECDAHDGESPIMADGHLNIVASAAYRRDACTSGASSLRIGVTSFRSMSSFSGALSSLDRMPPASPIFW